MSHATPRVSSASPDKSFSSLRRPTPESDDLRWEDDVEPGEDAVTDNAATDEPVVPETSRRRARGGRRRWHTWRRWSAFLLALLLGAIAASVAGFVVRQQPADYQSSSAIAVDQLRPLVFAGDAGIVAKLVSLRFKYTGYVTTLEFADAVAHATNLPSGTVHRALFASAAPNSLILELGASTHAPALSQKIASAAADALVQHVRAEQTAAGIKPDAQVTTRVVTPATGAVQTSPTVKKEVGAAGVAGLVVAALVLSVAALRSRED